jgi:hypothetical protein
VTFLFYREIKVGLQMIYKILGPNHSHVPGNCPDFNTLACELIQEYRDAQKIAES